MGLDKSKRSTQKENINWAQHDSTKSCPGLPACDGPGDDRRHRPIKLPVCAGPGCYRLLGGEGISRIPFSTCRHVWMQPWMSCLGISAVGDLPVTDSKIA